MKENSLDNWLQNCNKFDIINFRNAFESKFAPPAKEFFGPMEREFVIIFYRDILFYQLL